MRVGIMIGGYTNAPLCLVAPVIQRLRENSNCVLMNLVSKERLRAVNEINRESSSAELSWLSYWKGDK